MRNITTIILLSAAAAWSCADDLANTNINPNAAQKAEPNYLLSNAIRTGVDNTWGTTSNLDGSLLFIQHVAKIQYTEIDRYIAATSTFEVPWSSFYTESLEDLNQLIKLADASSNPNYKGVATIFRSWIFLQLTDTYGEIPYLQAGSITEHITPTYNTQREVYLGLLAELKGAISILNPTGKAISGDLLYGGNLLKWEKLANSLRLRIALRIADREPAIAQAEIQSISTDKLIGDGDIAQLVYISSPNQNPISKFFETRDDYRVSKSIVDKLKALHDPRLAIFANKTEAATPEEYIGVPNGLSNSAASALGFSKTSKIGSYFTAPNAPGVILTPAEVLFSRAEAAARGYTNDDAATLYYQAIRASFKQYGITDASIVDSYLAQPAVQYNSSNFRQSIGDQKWIALFGQGLEAFAEWRRLDYPTLTPAVEGTLNGKIPLRFLYPGTEQSLNAKSWKQAVERQGEDLLTTRLWFDVQ